MATTKAAGSGTTGIAKKTPAGAPAKQAAGTGAVRGASAKAPAKQTATNKRTATKKSATRKTATMTGAASTATAAKSLAKKTAVTKAATPRSSAVKSASGTVPASKSASKSAAKATPKTTASGASAGRSRTISPEQALANTRGLLEAKREHARQPQSWQAIGPSHGHPGSEGFQSPSAMDKAEELHAAESRLTPIQGSISTHDRHNQGKRDSR